MRRWDKPAAHKVSGQTKQVWRLATKVTWLRKPVAKIGFDSGWLALLKQRD